MSENEICLKYEDFDFFDAELEKKSENKRKRTNAILYKSLVNDKHYRNVKFDLATGALKAVHIGHNIGDTKGLKAEKKLLDMLFNCGRCVILCDEQKKDSKGFVKASLDMILDGLRMDIKAITKNKDYYGYAIWTKVNQLARFNSRSDVKVQADSICFFFDDPAMFNPKKILDGYCFMLANSSKYYCLRHILCFLNNGGELELKVFNFFTDKVCSNDAGGMKCRYKMRTFSSELPGR